MVPLPKLIAPLHQGRPEIHRQATAGAMLRLRDAGVLVRNSKYLHHRRALDKIGLFLMQIFDAE
jgi:hypothetical protein